MLYSGKYKLKMMPSGHKYFINGQEKPGVTSILSILNKPGLPQWAANQVTDYIKNHSEPFLKEENYVRSWVVTYYELLRARKAFTNSRDDSAIIGKNVHAWIEEHIKHKLENIELPEEYTKAMEPSIKAFLQWEEENKPEYIFSERIIYSEKGDYCGTCDVGINLNGKRVILDFKTGKPEKEYNRKLKRYTGKTRAYSTVFIQDALYDLAIEEEDGKRADQYGALYLPVNSEALFCLTDDTDIYRQAARSIVKTHRTLNEINKVNEFK